MGVGELGLEILELFSVIESLWISLYLLSISCEWVIGFIGNMGE